MGVVVRTDLVSSLFYWPIYKSTLTFLLFASPYHVELIPRPDAIQMRLVQGLMSALSSGMLIYASCIEMLAGDFIMDQQLKIGPVRAQVIALVSLVAGVIGMAGIGL